MIDISIDNLKKLDKSYFKKLEMLDVPDNFHNYIIQWFYKKHKFKWGSLEYKAIFTLFLVICALVAIICASHSTSLCIFILIYLPTLFFINWYFRLGIDLNNDLICGDFEYVKLDLFSFQDGYCIATHNGNFFMSDYIIGVGSNVYLLRFETKRGYEFVICLKEDLIEV